MAVVYNPFDVFVARRNANSSSFEEKALSSLPNSVVMFDSASNFVSVTSSLVLVGSSSYAVTSSYSLNGGGSSLGTGSTYPLTSSWSQESILAMYALSASWASSSISSSYSDTSSFALNIPTGTPTYFPDWDGGGKLSSTSLLKSDGTTVSVNEAVPSSGPGSSTEVLAIKAYDDEFNAVKIVGTVDSYLQTNIQNKNFGSQASTDIVATSDDGTEDNNYIDVGVNSSNYDVADFALQKAHDGYVYVNGGNLIVGTYTTESVVKIHAGGLQQNNLIAILSEQHGLEASGSFYGTASYSTNGLSSSFSETSSYFNQKWLNTGSTYPITSSWSEISSLSVTSSNSNSSSYIIPGATLYVVSGSNGVPPSFIEPYDIPIDPYNPPYKEGRMFYDSDFHNWVYYPDQNFKLHIGKEIIWRVHNPYSYTLPATTAVYISGSTTGVLPDVYKAIADGTNTKSDVAGIIRSDIPSGSFGYILCNGIIHDVNVGSFQIGDKVWLSNTVEGGFLNSEPGQPYESIRIGVCQEAGSNGSIALNITQYPAPPTAYAGITSTIFLSNNNDGTIVMPTGSVNLYDDPTGYGRVTSYSLTETQLTLVTGSTNYVIAERSGSIAAQYLLTTDSTYANGISIVRVATLDINYKGPGDWDVHEFEIGIVGLALANRSNNKDIRLYGYQRENGLTLYTTGSTGEFGITEGNIWYGPNSHTVPTFDTTLSGHYAYIFHTTSSNGTSSWHQDTSSIYVNNYYDNGSDLTPVTPGYYTVNFVYRLMGTEDEAAIVMSSQEFTTSLEASNNAITPSNLPSTIRDIGLLVGRFVVQSGSFSPLIESAFANTFIPAVVTSHESLTGLQGGQGGEHNHLTLDEYTGTGTGVFLRSYKPVFTGATQYHIPYWDTTGHLTLTGSVQVYEGQYVMINSGSFFDSTNPEALLVKQLNTSSVNTIGAYSDVDNYSQIYNQNNSSGSFASTDMVATADAGGQTTNYVDVGIASSQYNNPLWPWLKPLDAYVEVDGGDLWIGTLTNNVIKFMINNTASIGYFDATGIHASGSLIGTSSNANSSSYSLSSSYFNQLWLNTGSSYPITSSWSEYSIHCIDSISSSFASSSISSSYSTTSSLSNNSIISTTSLYASQSQWSVSSSFASSSVSSSYLPIGLYNITSSWSINYTSSIVNNQLPQQINVNGITASVKGNVNGTSSWSSNSVNLGLTAYNISVAYASQSQWAMSSSFASSSFTASYLPVATYFITSSWATNSITATNLELSAYNISVTYASQSRWSTSASFASSSLTASYVTASNIVGTVESSSYTLSASYAPGALITGNTYTITSSWSVTSSYSKGIPTIKSGIVSGSIFAGTPRVSSVVFGSSFPNNNYSLVVSGEPSRTWTIQNKSSNGFTINSNNNSAMTGLVFWQAIIIGEYYS